jgi:5'-deoxy-5'-methylthioadenosine phosphorylase
MLAIIGGSGLTQYEALDGERTADVPTPYGSPSAPLVCGKLNGRDIVFLARHGGRHTIPPHRINYRANVWALHAVGVKDVIAVATVGGIRQDLGPGVLVIPDQIIDYTHGRESTFYSGGEEGVMHVDFTRPYCEALRQRLIEAGAGLGERVIDRATYGATQGPRLETAAEIDRMERDGADIVGMTAMPEAALAREKGLCYATLAVVVNYAAGRGDSRAGIRLEELGPVLKNGMTRVCGIVNSFVKQHGA